MERLPHSRQQRPPRSRVALLGTIGHLHAEVVRYDLERLRTLVETLEPDLLAVEVERDAWESGVPERLPLEVRMALAPASRLTDTVVVPLGAEPRLALANQEGKLGRLRAALIQRAEELLTAKARAIDDPAGLSRGAYMHLCSGVCNLEAAAAGKDGRVAWTRANDRIIERLREVVSRNPGSRVLVAVNCRRLHVLTRRFRGLADEVELIRFEDLIPRDPLVYARSARAQEGTSR